jgi:hypothetical protein
MINWHRMVMKKGLTWDELNKAFALKTEIFHPKASGSKSQKVDVLICKMAMRMLR